MTHKIEGLKITLLAIGVAFFGSFLYRSDVFTVNTQGQISSYQVSRFRSYSYEKCEALTNPNIFPSCDYFVDILEATDGYCPINQSLYCNDYPKGEFCEINCTFHYQHIQRIFYDKYNQSLNYIYNSDANPYANQTINVSYSYFAPDKIIIFDPYMST